MHDFTQKTETPQAIKLCLLIGATIGGEKRVLSALPSLKGGNAGKRTEHPHIYFTVGKP